MPSEPLWAKEQWLWQKPEVLTKDGGASDRRDYAKDAAVCIGRGLLKSAQLFDRLRHIQNHPRPTGTVTVGTLTFRG